MLHSDTEYYRQRAAAERELATNAISPKAAAIHEELARGYDALSERREALGMLRAVG